MDILDYNDLEHFTLKLLYKENGEFSDTAKNLSENFEEIYVDEYQDVNPLQNKIFEALSHKSKIFMVGDIKQSIYGFRGAKPEIFAKHRREFGDGEGSKEKGTSTVFLSENFRCDKPIIDFVNSIFDVIFNSPEGENYLHRIPYGESDSLVYGKTTDNPEKEVEILIAEYKKDKSEEKGSHSAAKKELEAKMVAMKISELVESGVRVSDIAVIMRNAKNTAGIFKKHLIRYGIPVQTESSSKLFDSPEIQLLICVLNCIDNPCREIYLTGALRSPIFGFTFEELIEIRECEREGTLYSALVRYCEKHEYPKGRNFIEFIKRMKKISLGAPIDKIIWSVYNETSFFSIIYDGGEVSETLGESRRGNLIKFHSMARDYAANGKTTLYGFLRTVETLMKSGKSPESAGSGSENAVKIMTIHKSKGLEFEYCFICGTDRDFNNMDSREAIVYDDDLALGCKLKDRETRLTYFNTPIRNAIMIKTQLTKYEEEMRMLYVALTRARHRLYICGTAENRDELLERTKNLSRPITIMTFLKQKSYLEWILTSLSANLEKAPKYALKFINMDKILDGEPEVAEESFDADEVSEQDTEKLYKEIKSKLEYKYPYPESRRIPAKLTVSKLYPGILDETVGAELREDDFSASEFTLDCVFEEDRGENLPEDESKDNFSSARRGEAGNLKIPKFLEKSKSYSGADRGTATHIFMQFCDFELAEKYGAEKEIERLYSEKFITEQHKELIDRRNIDKFFSSALYAQIKESEVMKREYRFNIKLPASNFTIDSELQKSLEGEEVFVQGVIDCYFENRNKNITLVDYKTDYIPRQIRGSDEDIKNYLSSRHSQQLSYYRAALERLTKKKVSEIYVYSFYMGKAYQIDTKEITF